MKIGDWVSHKERDSFRQGRIERIENGTIYYFDQDIFDGFGATCEVSASECTVRINGQKLNKEVA